MIATVHADLQVRRTSAFPPQIVAVLDARIAEHQRLPWDVPLSGVIQS